MTSSCILNVLNLFLSTYHFLFFCFRDYTDACGYFSTDRDGVITFEYSKEFPIVNIYQGTNESYYVRIDYCFPPELSGDIQVTVEQVNQKLKHNSNCFVDGNSLTYMQKRSCNVCVDNEEEVREYICGILSDFEENSVVLKKLIEKFGNSLVATKISEMLGEVLWKVAIH